MNRTILSSEKSINDWIVEGPVIVSQQQRLQSTQFINGAPAHPALLSDWCYYNNTSVIHCAPGSALIKPSLWHQIQMIFYSAINLRWLSPFVGVCYEHVSWGRPLLSFPCILLCPVEFVAAPVYRMTFTLSWQFDLAPWLFLPSFSIGDYSIGVASHFPDRSREAHGFRHFTMHPSRRDFEIWNCSTRKYSIRLLW